VSGLCRDCLGTVEEADAACPACGSRRVVRHPALERLAIAHIDCDAFYAAIHKRDDPSLADKPVIIGGGRRGVVATACYVARAYGVRSAMPMFKALAACPNAIVIRPDMALYAAEGRAIRSMMQALTPLVEPVSIDEAYLDLGGTQRLHGGSPARTLMALQKQIEAERGLTVSVGLGPNKFLAKIASDLDKPRGFAVIGREEAAAFLAPRPVRFIHGVGPAQAADLEKAGYSTIGALAAAPRDRLVKRLGPWGGRLWALAHGDDDRPVEPESERKSVSAETTFEADLQNGEALEDRLWALCTRVAERSKAAGVAGRVATLKLKTSDFRTLTRRETLPAPTQTARTLFATVVRLLRAEPAGKSYRLIGAGLSDLCDPTLADKGDLLDQAPAKRAALEAAEQAARARFGADAIATGRDLRLAAARQAARSNRGRD
jgi:DNA polymerase-4